MNGVGITLSVMHAAGLNGKGFNGRGPLIIGLIRRQPIELKDVKVAFGSHDFITARGSIST
jgi:hypothetical protein